MTMKRFCLFLLLALIALPAPAQIVRGVDMDTTSVRVGGRSAVQVGSLELEITVTFAPGDTLHTSPQYSGRALYTLLARDSTVVVTSRPIDLISHPAIRGADKQRGQAFVDNLVSLLISLKGLQEE